MLLEWPTHFEVDKLCGTGFDVRDTDVRDRVVQIFAELFKQYQNAVVAQRPAHRLHDSTARLRLERNYNKNKTLENTGSVWMGDPVKSLILANNTYCNDGRFALFPFFTSLANRPHCPSNITQYLLCIKDASRRLMQAVGPFSLPSTIYGLLVRPVFQSGNGSFRIQRKDR